MNWLPKKTIVVPVDFSEKSIAAVDTALQLVDDPSAVHLVHVLPILAATEPGVVWDTVSDDSRREHAEQALRKQFPDSRYAGIHVAVAFGDAGHEITAHAGRVAAELIVLPSHGRTGLTRLLIGSVAERVCRLAHCPVLVLRD